MEDETKSCKFGVVTKYFDTCTCSGCDAERRREMTINNMANKVKNAAKEVYRATPENKWHTITSIKVPKPDDDVLKPSDYF